MISMALKNTEKYRRRKGLGAKPALLVGVHELVQSSPRVLWCAQSLSCVWLFATPWTVAFQAPLSLGILQARILEWASMPSSRGSSWPRDWTQVSTIAGRFFSIWATREAWDVWFSSINNNLLVFQLPGFVTKLPYILAPPLPLQSSSSEWSESSVSWAWSPQKVWWIKHSSQLLGSATFFFSVHMSILMIRSAERAPESVSCLLALPKNTMLPPVSTQESISKTQSCKRHPSPRPGMPCILGSRYHNDKHHHGTRELHHQCLQGQTYSWAPSTRQQGQQAASSSQLLWGLTQLQAASMSEARPPWGRSPWWLSKWGSRAQGRSMCWKGCVECGWKTHQCEALCDTTPSPTVGYCCFCLWHCFLQAWFWHQMNLASAHLSSTLPPVLKPGPDFVICPAHFQFHLRKATQL